MTSNSKLMEKARDELFSHINRCGVLQAEQDDQAHWMQETIEYIGERYPDLSEADLKGLHSVGMRFCQPAIAHNSRAAAVVTHGLDESDEATEVDEATENTRSEDQDANAVVA